MLNPSDSAGSDEGERADINDAASRYSSTSTATTFSVSACIATWFELSGRKQCWKIDRGIDERGLGQACLWKYNCIERWRQPEESWLEGFSSETTAQQGRSQDKEYVCVVLGVISEWGTCMSFLRCSYITGNRFIGRIEHIFVYFSPLDFSLLFFFSFSLSLVLFFSSLSFSLSASLLSNFRSVFFSRSSLSIISTLFAVRVNSFSGSSN